MSPRLYIKPIGTRRSHFIYCPLMDIFHKERHQAYAKTFVFHYVLLGLFMVSCLFRSFKILTTILPHTDSCLQGMDAGTS